MYVCKAKSQGGEVANKEEVEEREAFQGGDEDKGDDIDKYADDKKGVYGVSGA